MHSNPTPNKGGREQQRPQQSPGNPQTRDPKGPKSNDPQRREPPVKKQANDRTTATKDPSTRPDKDKDRLTNEGGLDEGEDEQGEDTGR